ncbi:hypothetical protein VP01_1493g2 [Puccinia sorghi]|uniref:Uncharacterized protein n=1 Tax=Puccinia sorghi TaxID=27349 RepID=A0A0L6VJC9_9BASI|nr:hypothetical protein VP01_1493g2 [Puccinia sorghi]
MLKPLFMGSIFDDPLRKGINFNPHQKGSKKTQKLFIIGHLVVFFLLDFFDMLVFKILIQEFQVEKRETILMRTQIGPRSKTDSGKIFIGLRLDGITTLSWKEGMNRILMERSITNSNGRRKASLFNDDKLKLLSNVSGHEVGILKLVFFRISEPRRNANPFYINEGEYLSALELHANKAGHIKLSGSFQGYLVFASSPELLSSFLSELCVLGFSWVVIVLVDGWLSDHSNEKSCIAGKSSQLPVDAPVAWLFNQQRRVTRQQTCLQGLTLTVRLAHHSETVTCIDARGVKPMVDHEIIIPDRVPGARWDFRVDTQQQILTRGFSFLSSKRNHTNFSTRKRGIGLSGKGYCVQIIYELPTIAHLSFRVSQDREAEIKASRVLRQVLWTLRPHLCRFIYIQSFRSLIKIKLHRMNPCESPNHRGSDRGVLAGIMTDVELPKTRL